MHSTRSRTSQVRANITAMAFKTILALATLAVTVAAAPPVAPRAACSNGRVASHAVVWLLQHQIAQPSLTVEYSAANGLTSSTIFRRICKY